MKKKITAAVSFVLILVLLLLGISRLFLSHSLYGNIRKEPDNSLDYIFIGDSECKTSISPVRIWEKTGFRGFNCGVSAQPIQETYYDLQNYLKNQKPAAVIFETNALYRKQAKENIAENFALHAVGQVFSVYENHGDWKNYLTRSKRVQYDRKQQNVLCGWHFHTGCTPYTGELNYMRKTKARERIQPEQMTYLNLIRELCQAHGVQLILYNVPAPKNWNQARHNAVADYARKYGLLYEDLNQKVSAVGINWSEDTSDGGDHVNVQGAIKVSDYMARYLQQNLKTVTPSKKSVRWFRKNRAYLTYMDTYKKIPDGNPAPLGKED